MSTRKNKDAPFDIPAINNEQCVLGVYLGLEEVSTCESELPVQIGDNDGVRAFNYKGDLFLVARVGKIKTPDKVIGFNSSLWAIKQEASNGDLDKRMAKAGMMPVSEMLERNTLGKFNCHAGVTDLDKFEEWIQMRREEFICMQAEMELDGLQENELFEWVVTHNAILGEVMANFRQALGRDS